ncbi:MAG: adenosylmethionine decarboxylase [Nitrospinae bacterium]|nr:adenosylmethionine decarboxylase [Nitrospinota bacterium]
MNSLGRHLLAEFYDCGTDALNDPGRIERLMNEAARLSGATVVESAFHAFSPHGVSGVVVVEESHLAVHTWPEYRYAAVDYFSCGEVDCDAAVRYLAEHLLPSRVETKEVPRGVIERSEAPVSAPLASNGGGEASLSARNGEGRER